MPQARRKTPFSGKAKKQQLQSKKQNKNLLTSSGAGTGLEGYDVLSVNYQPGRQRGGREANRYALKFYRENDEELQLKKEEAMKSLHPVPESELEIDPRDFFPAELSFPKRPPWDFNMTVAQLDAQEQRYFKVYVKSSSSSDESDSAMDCTPPNLKEEAKLAMEYIQKLQSSEHWKDISYFELNLETWRQLWRVLEMCDILLLVADVRYAGMMYPPSLYDYVVNDLKKDMILVLNKIDLVPATVVAAWKEYLTRTSPGLKVVYFTSCPGYNLHGTTADKAGLQVRRRKGRQRMCTEGATKLFEACKELVNGEVDLTSWETKIKEETGQYREEDEALQVGETITEKPDTSFYKHERYKNGVLTIGCVGQPNVGKSSLMNAIMGRKVVSVSRTPGHTKHFQTIYLTPNVRLCDCPGLVFPSKVPRPIQILMGSYPIAQLREPYTTIRYLAERLDLPKLLRIEHPENDDTWSPRDICDGWAKKRGYLTAKAARLDTYRAANSLLRMALDGKICLWLRPPGYIKSVAKFEASEELKYIKWVQALTKDDDVDKRHDVDVITDSDDAASSVDNSDADNDNDDSDDGSDREELKAMANKFAALGGDD